MALRPPRIQTSALVERTFQGPWHVKIRPGFEPPWLKRSVYSFRTVEKCPAPSCPCQEMPAGLDIDHALPLEGTMPAYAEHVVVSTGRSDWASRIEDDEGLGVIRSLKALLTKGGKYANPFHNVMVSASSFASHRSDRGPSALLLPSFTWLPHFTSFKSDLPMDDRDALEAFVQAFVTARHLDSITSQKQPWLQRDEVKQECFNHQRVYDIVILICGHGGRDSRCGVMGKLLQAEFEDKLRLGGMEVIAGPTENPGSGRNQNNPAVPKTHQTSDMPKVRAMVGLISHIGGHKFAGNVIIYIPPVLESHPLKGTGIWYGRVEPKHVEGIVEQTIYRGLVIQELFRGQKLNPDLQVPF